jgi:hypothetical protein
MDSVHVLPLNDLVEHETDDACICGPTLGTDRPDGTQHCSCGCSDGNAGVVWVHHALDGRD